MIHVYALFSCTIGMKGQLPTRSLCGPTAIAFQLNETFEGQFVNPS